jgi:hypothetical protein
MATLKLTRQQFEDLLGILSADQVADLLAQLPRQQFLPRSPDDELRADCIKRVTKQLSIWR